MCASSIAIAMLDVMLQLFCKYLIFLIIFSYSHPVLAQLFTVHTEYCLLFEDETEIN